MTRKLKVCLFAVALAILAGCASMSHHGAIAMPAPLPDDIEGQIMSVTGPGFTICAVNADTPDHSDQYDVTVCGNVSKAQAALPSRFAKKCTLRAYQAGDGGTHTPQQLVIQWWANRTTGPAFVVVSTRITDDGTIDVGIDGDLKAAKDVLDRQFPGWTKVHAEVPAGNLPGPKKS